MALLPTRFQSVAEPRYGGRMMYDAAPIMDGGYGLLDGAMLAPAVEQQVLPAAQPMTQEDQYARRIAANTPPQGTLITSSLSNKGNATGFGPGNTFRVRDDQEVRITDNKGKVLFSGFGPEAARQAVALGQNITAEKGNKAGWMIQTGDRTINADGTVGSTRWNDVAREKVNKSVIGKIADVALPVVGAIVAGPLGAAAGSAASSVAQGRSFENTLLRAGLAAGGSALGGQVFGPASSAASSAAGSTAGSAAGGVAGTVAGTTAGSTIGSAVGDIIVNAAPNLLGSTVGSAVGSTVGSVVPSLIPAPSPTTPSAPTNQPIPEEIVVTAPQTQPPAVDLGGVLGALPLAPTMPSPTPMPEEIVVTGNVPQSTTAPLPIPGFEAAIPAIIPGALSPAQTAGTPPSGNDGVLGTGLNIPQLLSLGGVGADLLKNLLAGGGGAGAGTPYVSPFGTGVGFAPGQDMRANPNIIDYERYGFGPEAMFFQPGYGLLSAGAAPQAQPIMAVPQAQPAMMTNPRYEPLI